MTTTPGGASSQTLAEIASQPRMWQAAIDLGRTAPPGVPGPGERVLVLGCGTSYYVGLAYAEIRESAVFGVTDVLIASEVPPVFRPYDRVVAISRSGTSSELLDAVRLIAEQQPGIPVTALLGEQGTPLAALATDIVDLSFADEQSLVQTRFPTTQLALLRAAMAEQEPAGAAYDRSPLDGLNQLVALCERPWQVRCRTTVFGNSSSSPRGGLGTWARRPRSRCASRRAPGWSPMQSVNTVTARSRRVVRARSSGVWIAFPTTSSRSSSRPAGGWNTAAASRSPNSRASTGMPSLSPPPPAATRTIRTCSRSVILPADE